MVGRSTCSWWEGDLNVLVVDKHAPPYTASAADLLLDGTLNIYLQVVDNTHPRWRIELRFVWRSAHTSLSPGITSLHAGPRHGPLRQVLSNSDAENVQPKPFSRKLLITLARSLQISQIQSPASPPSPTQRTQDVRKRECGFAPLSRAAGPETGRPCAWVVPHCIEHRMSSE